MSFYNMMFGKNSHTSLILSLLDLQEHDIERFRDVDIDYDKKTIEIYTRTGGGNRADYPNEILTKHSCYLRDWDDSYDETYANYLFKFPENLTEDICKLGDISANGIPASIIQQYNKVLGREQTDADKRNVLYEDQHKLVQNLKASGDVDVWNGHTVVPLSDYGMKCLLGNIEEHGKFIAYWSIKPFRPDIRLNDVKWRSLDANKPKIEQDRRMVVIHSPSKWVIDEEWWNRWQEKFSEKYPKAIKIIAEGVNKHLEKQAA